jgi:mycothiol synthase
MSSSYRRLPVDGSGADRQVLQFAQDNPSGHVHVVDLPYRLSSWGWSPAQTMSWSTADGELHAWACLQTPFWSLDFAVHPDAPPALTGEVLAWADARADAVSSTAYGRPMWFAFAFSDQHGVIAALEAAGFEVQTDAADAWSMVLMRHAPHSPGPQPDLPQGFTVRSLRGQVDLGAYVDLHRSVFNSDSMTEDWRAAVLRQPGYDADLDLVITDADDALVAFCVGWLGPTGWGHRPSGQIEPLGVAERCRGHGLGTVLAGECVRRLYAKGARDVYVETDSHRDAALAMYEGVGFRVERSIVVFRKSYPAAVAEPL